MHMKLTIHVLNHMLAYLSSVKKKEASGIYPNNSCFTSLECVNSLAYGRLFKTLPVSFSWFFLNEMFYSSFIQVLSKY